MKKIILLLLSLLFIISLALSQSSYQIEFSKNQFKLDTVEGKVKILSSDIRYGNYDPLLSDMFFEYLVPFDKKIHSITLNQANT